MTSTTIRRSAAGRTDARPERGFALIVLIVGVAVLALLAAILPEDAFVSATFREQAEDEMEAIAYALHDYYGDNGSFPPALSALAVEPGTLSTWLGPYAVPAEDEAHDYVNDFTRDPWGNAYGFAVTSIGKATLTSAGRDEAPGTSDDVQLVVDCADLLRDQCLAEIDLVEGAILAWNVDCLPGSPLSTNYSALLDTLQTWGYLPAGAAVKAQLLTDPWGNQYVTGPAPVFDIDTVSGL